MNLIQHFVNGQVTSGKSDRTGKVFNPATGNQESEVKLGSKADLDAAVSVPKKAFLGLLLSGWSVVSADRCARLWWPVNMTPPIV